MADKPLEIEQSGNSVYAVLTPEGPAIFASLDDARHAAKVGVLPEPDDAAYYESRAKEWPWYPVKDQD